MSGFRVHAVNLIVLFQEQGKLKADAISPFIMGCVSSKIGDRSPVVLERLSTLNATNVSGQPRNYESISSIPSGRQSSTRTEESVKDPDPGPGPDIGLIETFEYVKELGKGGTGETLQYRNRQTHEIVAIKLIRRPIPAPVLPSILREITARPRLHSESSRKGQMVETPTCHTCDLWNICINSV